jgi:glycosyltransferase involved in cell wall biosynthesis
MAREALVITTLDYVVEKNQRCQHIARALAKKYGATVVISKHRNLSVRSVERLRKLLPAVRVLREGRVKVYDLNPPLNQSFGRPFRMMGLLAELLVLPSMLLLFFTNVRRKFSVCYAEGPWEALLALFLRLMGKVDTIIYGDIDYQPSFQERPSRAKLIALLERCTMRRADLVVCTGSMLAERRKREMRIDPVVNHNGVNYRAFSAGAVKDVHPPGIIYFGNFEERYSGLALALQAFPRIRERIPEVTMTLIGPDPGGRIARQIAALGIGAAVKKLDPVPYIELPHYVRRADVGYALFPPNQLRTYAFPMKVIEYMAGGLAVVGTGATETERIILKYGAGVAVPYDPEAYVNAVVELFAHPERIRQMAENGVRAASDFDWDILTGRFLESVEKVTGEVRR